MNTESLSSIDVYTSTPGFHLLVSYVLEHSPAHGYDAASFKFRIHIPFGNDVWRKKSRQISHDNFFSTVRLVAIGVHTDGAAVRSLSARDRCDCLLLG